ncbi:hypothetical protein [Gorillibacterium sp. sgz500922]|uniref:hypothetical protein n=1 Tax=Gorillibacterium sp. sgz500922 TaxID=3446694 RepID=UPI003F66B8A9
MPNPLTGLATGDELEMIRDFILMPHLVEMLTRSRTDVDRAPIGLLKPALIHVADALLDRATREHKALRQELAGRRIKVHDAEFDGEMVYYYPYTCRGYEDRFGIMREVMRTELSIKLGRYVGDVQKTLREANRAGV